MLLFLLLYMSFDRALSSGEELLKWSLPVSVTWGDTVPCTLWFLSADSKDRLFPSLPSRVREVSRGGGLSPLLLSSSSETGHEGWG